MNRHDPVNSGEIRILYSWIAASATRWATESLASAIGRCRQTSGTAFQGIPEIRFEIIVGRIEQLAPGNDHDVHSALRPVGTTENLSNQSFSSVSSDRIPEFPGGDDPKPARAGFVWRNQDRQVPALGPERQVEDSLEFTTTSDPAILRETLGRHGSSSQA